MFLFFLFVFLFWFLFLLELLLLLLLLGLRLPLLLLREFRLHAEHVADHDQSGRLVGVQVPVQHNDCTTQYEMELCSATVRQDPHTHTRTGAHARHAMQHTYGLVARSGFQVAQHGIEHLYSTTDELLAQSWRMEE